MEKGEDANIYHQIDLSSCLGLPAVVEEGARRWEAWEDEVVV